MAAFPKCFMDDLCKTRRMSIFDWIDIAKGIGVDGLELYPDFLMNNERSYLLRVKNAIYANGLSVPMFCVSPDFTHPDPLYRKRQLEKYRRILDIAAFFEGQTCRILSGQAYPEVGRSDGIKRVVECIQIVISDAAARGIILVMENHYKDNYWNYPEFAQPSDIFLEIIKQINSPWFGVNYDPSNAILAGEDPIELLKTIKEYVVSMHASDRYLKDGGNLNEIKSQYGIKGYPDILVHGEIGKGLNNYDKIFTELKSVDFDGWISIEDGVNGLDELKRSVQYLRTKIKQYFN